MNLKKHTALIMGPDHGPLRVLTAALAATDYNRGIIPTESTTDRSTTGERTDGGIKRDGMTNREPSFNRDCTENRSTNNTGGGYTYNPGATHPDGVRHNNMNTGQRFQSALAHQSPAGFRRRALYAWHRARNALPLFPFPCLSHCLFSAMLV